MEKISELKAWKSFPLRWTFDISGGASGHCFARGWKNFCQVEESLDLPFGHSCCYCKSTSTFFSYRLGHFIHYHYPMYDYVRAFVFFFIQSFTFPSHGCTISVPNAPIPSFHFLVFTFNFFLGMFRLQPLRYHWWL